MKEILTILFLVTTSRSQYQFSSQYTYKQTQTWQRQDGPIQTQTWKRQDGPIQLNQQPDQNIFQAIKDFKDLPIDQIFRDIQNFDDTSKLFNQFQGNIENPARQVFQQWQDLGPGRPQLNQGNQFFQGYMQNPTANREFNLPDAVRNEVNEEASNRQAAANQKALQGAPKCSASTKKINPCTRKIEVPNFRKPGRRLAEIKCLEYIWDIKNEEEQVNKTEECIVYQRQCLNNTSSRGFVGGRLTEKGEFPHMGALGWRATEGGWIFKCGSSMISPKFMVSAAHCSRTRRDPKIANPVPEIVRIGAKNLEVFKDTLYPKDIEIANIIKHPNYKAPKQYYDIALVELKENLMFDERIRPACLWSRFDTSTVDSSVTGSGWGVTEVGGKETTTELRAGDLDIIYNEYCDQLLKSKCNRLWCGLQDHQMCAGKLAGGVDACQGDSGGPLQAKINLHSSIKGRMYYLLGVTSFGFGCARENTPGIYTRISGVVDWIESIVWPNERA